MSRAACSMFHLRFFCISGVSLVFLIHNPITQRLSPKFSVSDQDTSPYIYIYTYIYQPGLSLSSEQRTLSMDQFDSHAEWKLQGRLEQMTRMFLKGKHVSNIFLPWLDSYSIFFATSTRASLQITLGICSTMWSAVTIPTCKEGTGSRDSDLFLKICNYYAAAPANEIASQLGNLTEGMIRKTASSSLRLRANAAEARR